MFHRYAQNFYELIPGQGHFGPDAIPGDVRCSSQTFLFMIFHGPFNPLYSLYPPLVSRLSFQQARWRRGEAVSLKSARDSMVSLEVAAHSQLALRKANAI